MGQLGVQQPWSTQFAAVSLAAKLHQSRTKFSEGPAKLFFFPMAHRDKAQISKLLRVLQDEKRPCDHILLSSAIFP